MDAEIQSFIKVWIIAITSLCYCYYMVSNISKGITRLLFLLPIIYLFITLPLNLTSIHLGAPTIFYLVWLANFKLLLFAFDKGPLSLSSGRVSSVIENTTGESNLHRAKNEDFLSSPRSRRVDASSKTLKSNLTSHSSLKSNENKEIDPLSSSSLSLPHFISIALLPIKTKENPKTNEHPFQKSDKKTALIALKAILLSTIIYIYQYRDNIHPYMILSLYCCHVYLGVELVLYITAIPVQAILGLEIEPQFNEPHLATSLQDFWGRRWNLMVTSILRPTVYYPVKSICTRILGRTWSTNTAIFATFLVSGLMHEIIYYYFTRVWPTWEVTWFFVIHGICTAFEVGVKKVLNGRWRLHRAVSGMITVGFVAVSGVWLFFPQIIRSGVDKKAIDEYSILVNFFKDRVRLF